MGKLSNVVYFVCELATHWLNFVGCLYFQNILSVGTSTKIYTFNDHKTACETYEILYNVQNCLTIGHNITYTI